MNIYKTALEVQDASNLSGVVYQFARDMKVICEEVRKNGGGTDAINHHPVCRLYAEQIAWLTGAGSCADSKSYRRAYDECVKQAAEPTTSTRDTSHDERFSYGELQDVLNRASVSLEMPDHHELGDAEIEISVNWENLEEIR